MAYDISLVLLVVELSLLVPTLLLIALGTREERARRRLLDNITNTARMLSRQEYFHSVETVMRSARESIKGSITGSSPRTGEQEESVQRIVRIIEQIKYGSSAVTIKYLLPKVQDRLCIAYRYTGAGAVVRFHPALFANDLRYVIVDRKSTVIGVPSTSGENQPTKEGYSIPSEALSEILNREFETSWSRSLEYEEYAMEVLTEIKSHSPTVSSKLLADQLMISKQEVERLLSLAQMYQQRPVEMVGSES